MEIVSEPDLRFVLYLHPASVAELPNAARRRKLVHMFASFKPFSGL